MKCFCWVLDYLLCCSQSFGLRGIWYQPHVPSKPYSTRSCGVGDIEFRDDFLMRRLTVSLSFKIEICDLLNFGNRDWGLVFIGSFEDIFLFAVDMSSVEFSYLVLNLSHGEITQKSSRYWGFVVDGVYGDSRDLRGESNEFPFKLDRPWIAVSVSPNGICIRAQLALRPRMYFYSHHFSFILSHVNMIYI